MPIDNNNLEGDIRVFAPEEDCGRPGILLPEPGHAHDLRPDAHRACGVDPLTWLSQVIGELPQREEAARDRRPAAVPVLQSSQPY